MDKVHNKNVFLKLMSESLQANDLEYRIIQNEELLDVDKLKIGLLSGFCVWSGGTFGVGKKVLHELSPELAKNEIPHFLLDCDFISPALQRKLFKTSGWGYFESCWVENGEILKRYNYKHELEPFLLFVKNRLKEISEYFTENIIEGYSLDSEKENFGIAEKAFVTNNKAIVRSMSKYKNQFLYDLMEYKKEGNYYLFEDDQLTIYEATIPTHLSSCFVQIKDGKKE